MIALCRPAYLHRQSPSEVHLSTRRRIEAMGLVEQWHPSEVVRAVELDIRLIVEKSSITCVDESTVSVMIERFVDINVCCITYGSRCGIASVWCYGRAVS